jgi:hypothetical protein
VEAVIAAFRSRPGRRSIARLAVLLASSVFAAILWRMSGPTSCVADAPWLGPPDPHRLRVLLAPVAGDPSGEVRGLIARVFDGHGGFDVRQSCTILPMQDAVLSPEADSLRVRSGADLIVWGERAQPRGAVTLRFAAEQGSFGNADRAWRFPREDVVAGGEARFGVPIRALAATIATPGLARWNTLAASLLPPLLPELRARATAPFPDWDENRVTAQRRIAAVALTLAGDATRNTALHRDAADMARLALGGVSAEEDPETWGTLKNHLGNTLRRIAESGHGDEAYDAIEVSIEAYRQALTVRTRDASPFAWAATRVNLARALSALAPWGGEEALREAVAAFDDGLTIRTRERFPLDWAITRAERARTLAMLSLFDDDAALAEALETIRDVRDVVPRAQDPMAWAWLSSVTGSVLVLGRDADSLRDAAVAYRDALLEFTADRDPETWAGTLTALAGTLQAIGWRGDEPALREAASAQRLALTVFTRERAPDAWARTQAELGDTLLSLARRGDAAAADEAVMAYRHALSAITPGTPALDRATLHELLGDALAIVGERPGKDDALGEAIASYREAMIEFTREDNPLRWAALQSRTGSALTLRAERGATEEAGDAIAALTAAREVFDLEGDAEAVARTEYWLARARVIRDRR